MIIMLKTPYIDAIIAILMAMSMSCNTNRIGAPLEDGDLIFSICESTPYSEAIAEATAQDEGPTFDHVGIFTIVDSDSMVIEATPQRGVTLTPLHDFVSYGQGFVSRRIHADISIADAVERAKGYIGKGYDWEFSPDNDLIYCSELVQLCYLRPDGTPIFESIPMNFLDHEGQMPQFWLDTFARLGKPIPQGAPGTNPNSIYQQCGIVK